MVPTSAGQTSSQVADAVALALAADPTLSALGITSLADGSRVVTTGTIEGLALNDVGLRTAALRLPSLSAPAIGLLVIGLAGTLVLVARRTSLGRAR